MFIKFEIILTLTKSILIFYIVYDYFNPLIIFGSGFILENTRKENYIRNINFIIVKIQLFY